MKIMHIATISILFINSYSFCSQEQTSSNTLPKTTALSISRSKTAFSPTSLQTWVTTHKQTATQATSSSSSQSSSPLFVSDDEATINLETLKDKDVSAEASPNASPVQFYPMCIKPDSSRQTQTPDSISPYFENAALYAIRTELANLQSTLTSLQPTLAQVTTDLRTVITLLASKDKEIKEAVAPSITSSTVVDKSTK